ncbi:MAG: protease modulator HflK [Pseudomonadota bacterium]
MRSVLLWGAAGAALLGWLASGVMMVDTGQQAVVYRFGAIDHVANAGLHLRLPWPIEADERLNVTEARRVELASARLLTADTNLVQLTLAVQYTVGDPVAWSLSASDSEQVVASLVQGTAMAAAASIDVDELLTTGRADLERRVLMAAQEAADRWQLGVRLVAVDVRELAPPGPVVDAFNDVSSARGDRETIALSAEAYASKLLPDVRGQAAEGLEQARADAARRTARARSETSRFEQLLPAWRQDREGTRIDLEARAVAAATRGLQVIVATPETEIVLPRHGAEK